MVKEARINLRILKGKAETWADEEGFAWMRFAEGAEIDEEDIRQIITMATETFVGEKFAVIVDIRGMQSITDGARKIAANKNLEHIYSALAIVIGSPATRIVANFFVQFHKPPRPTRIFTDPGEALNWLRKYMQN